MTATSTPTGVDSLLVETVERLLGDAAGFEVVEAAEQDGWSPDLWRALAEAGFPWISVDEKAGGSGGTLADAMAVLHSVGRHAAPVPVAETGPLGGWLAAAAGLEIPEGPLTVVPDPFALTLAHGRVVGEAVTAWAARAELVLALLADGSTWRIVAVRPDRLAVERGKNLAGEPRDLVRFDVAVSELANVVAPTGLDADALLLRGALTRANMAAGALAAMAQLTIDYTAQRHQFGRPIAAFQAVQQHLVTTAQSAARAGMAAAVATREAAGDRAPFAIAAARVVVNRASIEAIRSAHQAHGAMGLTREYPLHHLSRRLRAWQYEYGDDRFWRGRLGDAVGTAGADSLFELISH